MTGRWEIQRCWQIIQADLLQWWVSRKFYIPDVTVINLGSCTQTETHTAIAFVILKKAGRVKYEVSFYKVQTRKKSEESINSLILSLVLTDGGKYDNSFYKFSGWWTRHSVGDRAVLLYCICQFRGTFNPSHVRVTVIIETKKKLRIVLYMSSNSFRSWPSPPRHQTHLLILMKASWSRASEN